MKDGEALHPHEVDLLKLFLCDVLLRGTRIVETIPSLLVTEGDSRTVLNSAQVQFITKCSSWE
jgi:hypothetical protein